MSSKKSVRKQKKEAAQARSAAKGDSSRRLLVYVGLALALVVVAAFFLRGSNAPGDPPWPGAVWSQAHGHWH
jgi:hypothetical protein